MGDVTARGLGYDRVSAHRFFEERLILKVIVSQQLPGCFLAVLAFWASAGTICGLEHQERVVICDERLKGRLRFTVQFKRVRLAVWRPRRWRILFVEDHFLFSWVA